MRIAELRPKLDLRDIELVLAVAEAGSTVKAAASLHLTQSAVSRGLLLAEHKLGLALFERRPRGLEPTTAGKRLISGAGALLAEFVALEARLEHADPAPLRVRLACECYTAYRWLPSTLATLQREPQNVTVTLALDHTAAPVPALLAGELDVALLTTSVVRRPLAELPLFSDEIVFVMGKTHPLAARPHLTRADLVQYPLISSSQTPKPEARWFLKTAFGSSRPRLSWLRFPLTEAIIDAARANMGVAVLSEWIAQPYLDGGDLVLKRLRGRAIRRPWRIAFRPEMAEGAKRLLTVLQRAAPRAFPT
jgi:LysR family transcriptional regulator for metE and metH